MTSLQKLEGQARVHVLIDLAEKEASRDAWLIEYYITETLVLDAVVAAIAAEYAIADSALQQHGSASIGPAEWGDQNWEAVAGLKWPWRVEYTLSLPEHTKVTRSYVLVRGEPVTYRQDGRWNVDGAKDEYGRNSSYFTNLGDALLAAANAYAEQERWEQARQDEDVRREQRKAEREAKARDERQALLDILEGDQVAIALVKVFAALQDDREEWRQELDSAQWALENAGEREVRLEGRVSELRSQNEALDQRVTYERDRAYEAEENLNRERKRERRGW